MESRPCARIRHPIRACCRRAPQKRNYAWQPPMHRRRMSRYHQEGRMAPIQGNGAEIRELARYEVRPEALSTCLAAIHEFVAYVRANEPGALRYEVWQESAHPTRFVHIFVWGDAAANSAHGESAAVKKFAGILYPNCVAPVEFVQ